MQNIKVTTTVFLPSGAEVNLTDSQVAHITTLVNQLLFSSPQIEKVKRTYNRKKRYQHWTKEEDALLIPVLNMNESDTHKHYKKIKRQLNRNMNSVYGRVYELRKRSKKENKSVIPVTNFF